MPDLQKDTQIRILLEKVAALTREKDLALHDNSRLVTEVQQLSAYVGS